MKHIDTSIRTEQFSYSLPEASIASYPLADRSASKLLLYKGGHISHEHFGSLPAHLPQSSWLVFNNTRVIQARLRFRKSTGAGIEIFCLEPLSPADYEHAFQARGNCKWLCLVGNAKKWKSGPITMETSIRGEDLVMEAFVEERLDDGFIISFSWDHPKLSFGEIIEHSGSTPIPPYLNREAEDSDKERYQTIYSRNNGSVAAPTAGLHFTAEILQQLEAAGVRQSNLTLHVGAGTFVPVKEENARMHSMHSELVVVSRDFLQHWQKQHTGLIAVGTTSTRSLESIYWLGVKLMKGEELLPEELRLIQWDNEILPQNISLEESLQTLLKYCDGQHLEQIRFSTQLMIVPGYRFRCISGLITNFHMPGSTLLLLIAAWIGDDWKKVYDYALEQDFRFLSYGDSSLLLP